VLSAGSVAGRAPYIVVLTMFYVACSSSDAVRRQYTVSAISKRSVRRSDLGLRVSFGPWTGLIKKKKSARNPIILPSGPPKYFVPLHNFRRPASEFVFIKISTYVSSSTDVDDQEY
jgi:hypothetical protein